MPVPVHGLLVKLNTAGAGGGDALGADAALDGHGMDEVMGPDAGGRLDGQCGVLVRLRMNEVPDERG